LRRIDAITRPARTESCAQVTFAEVADTLETSPVELEVVAEVGQFVGDEVTVLVRLTTAGEVVPCNVCVG